MLGFPLKGINSTNSKEMDTKRIQCQWRPNGKYLHDTVPFLATVHTKAKELHYNILNKYLATNSFLKKISFIENESCTFC